jgi:6-phosphogluconolactonase (cycloisomerase 2 family)
LDSLRSVRNLELLANIDGEKESIKMAKGTKSIAILVCLLILATLGLAALSVSSISAQSLRSGAVYVMTNQVANAVAVFKRAPDGTLSPAGMFLTGGSGNPVPEPGDPPTDPLASQGSLILSDDNRFLFTVNAGSNEISVLAVGQTGLTLVDKVASGGTRPISLTLHKNLLYVLNEGGTPNITGFFVSNKGTLSLLPGSTRPLAGGSAADPAQVGFSSDGDVLTVTEKMTNIIDAYTFGGGGFANEPVANTSNGLTPFDFAYDRRGHLIVSEAFGGAPNQGAVSSYTVSEDGILSVVSGSVPNSQTAACWVVITNNGRYAFVSNTGSGTVSSYKIGSGGTLNLQNAAAGNTGPGSAPIDMALDNSSRQLYVLGGGSLMIHAFRVEADGSLTPIDGAGGLPPGVQSIAAR